MNKKYLSVIIGFVVIGVMVSVTQIGWAADTPLLIVTDPYEPFVFPPEADLKGMDYEVTEAVFQQLGIPIAIKIYPWKRCLAMMQAQQADGILDAGINEERKAYLFFPEEPLSQSSLVMFYHKDHPITVNTPDDLKQYRIGTLLGYLYPQNIADMLIHREDVNTMEQNFQKLAANRIDLMLEDRVVGLYKLASFERRERLAVAELPMPLLNAYYLGFAKKAGYDELAVKFSRALVAFKQTPAYHDILVKYGQVK